MKKRFLIGSFITLVLVCIISWIYMFRVENKIRYEDVHGKVYYKLDNPVSRYKSTKVTSEFILVIEKDDGHLFDIKVTPTTFVTHNVGDRIYFKHLSKSIIYDDYKDYTSLWAMINIAFSIFLLFWGFFGSLIEYDNS